MSLNLTLISDADLNDLHEGALRSVVRAARCDSPNLEALQARFDAIGVERIRRMTNRYLSAGGAS